MFDALGEWVWVSLISAIFWNSVYHTWGRTFHDVLNALNQIATFVFHIKF